MKPSLAPGVVFTRRIAIDRSRTIDFMGDAARVYATPALVRDIELACREGLLRHLDDGEDSVGSRIELDHIAPTLVGMDVDISARLVEAKGRLVTFEITARDAVEEVARGRHARFVVDVRKTGERLQAKAARVNAAKAAAS